MADTEHESTAPAVPAEGAEGADSADFATPTVDITSPPQVLEPAENAAHPQDQPSRPVGSARSSLVFVTSALESILASKDARKRPQLGDLCKQALNTIAITQDEAQIDPEILFAPLDLAAKSSIVSVVVTSIDCIGKLISYSYFSLPSSTSTSPPEGHPALIDRAIETICNTFQNDDSSPEIELQIIKSLLAATLNDKIVVHGAGLLKAVRLVYSIFITSQSPTNQQLAQGTLAQIVGVVFERAKARITAKESRSRPPSSSKDSTKFDSHSIAEGSAHNEGDESFQGDPDSASTITGETADSSNARDDAAPITLQSFENQKGFDDTYINDNAPTLVTPNNPDRDGSNRRDTQDSSVLDAEDEIYVKDAFLIFRAMCRLSTKQVASDYVYDLKSDAIRSKLLSLHIIHDILLNHMSTVISPYATLQSDRNDRPPTFFQTIRPYLCLSLSRNGASSVSRVFEVSCEIFWLVFKHLRVVLKKEIEVFMKEIYFSILDKRSIPPFQERFILRLLSRMVSDPQLLVEAYLNYDCDSTALDNIYQKTIESLARIASSPVQMTANEEYSFSQEQLKSGQAEVPFHIIPSLTTTTLSLQEPVNNQFSAYWLREDAAHSLIKALRSMLSWAQGESAIQSSDQRSQLSVEVHARTSLDGRNSTASPSIGNYEIQPADDDPGYLEREKLRKNKLINCIRLFDASPKKGIRALIEQGFIQSSAPEDIARYLYENTDQINKTSLGNYLGEGEPEYIAIMHAFVDLLDFKQTRFVDALRRFLQAFRLPGESQKIDRLVLKFAERYVAGNPNAFANADTAYVLAYSTIMLNTDQHSPSIAAGKRMSVQDFINNNRGINDSANLPDEYLHSIFEDISQNEIILVGEREAASLNNTQPKGLAASIGESIAGKYAQRERYLQVAEAMSSKTELAYKQLMRAERRNSQKSTTNRFISAKSSKHAGPMFQVTWMPFLTALASHAQLSTSSEPFRASMDGLKIGTRIACMFDLADPRQAFVSSLVKFTNLYNLSEMKEMNVEALKAVLEVAITEGDHLKESWRDVLTCLSQLDRFQLISTGVDEGQIPDVQKAVPHPSAILKYRKSLQVPTKSRQRSQSTVLSLPPSIAEESKSANMVLAVDRIFTNTANFSGEGIVHFVRALCQVSSREIESSGSMESPRTFSLQKVVEVSGYNMNRVRFEWVNIWQELGAHFTEVGHNTNISVVNFALDSLRQLSMRFMEIGELPGFRFQKDFLRPFEDIMKNTNLSKASDRTVVQDMILLCLMQILQAQGDNMRSGWRTIFAVLTFAAQEPSESLVTLAFQNVCDIYKSRFEALISQGAFRDFTECLAAFSKNSQFQKKALQSLDMLNSSVTKMLRAAECPLVHPNVKKNPPKITTTSVQPNSQPLEEQFWFPVLFAFHDILMTGEDLETRSMALTYLFQTLTNYGSEFKSSSWDTVWCQLLYPIFMVIRLPTQVSQANNDEELYVWLSTTLVQALRSLVQLFTHFFEALEFMLDRFLDLLAVCICQENDTLARIGSNCLQQLIAGNVSKFNGEHWHKIINCFIDLFGKTEASALFSTSSAATILPSETSESQARAKKGAGDEAGRPQQEQDAPLEAFAPDNNLTPAPAVASARRMFFNEIVTKCVLQLLMIETVHSLFMDEEVYMHTPSHELLRLMEMLKQSYLFARRFNQDRDLRARLFRDGFMKQLPNLLKQESGSANVYISILFRMYKDTEEQKRGLVSKDEDEDENGVAAKPGLPDDGTTYTTIDISSASSKDGAEGPGERAGPPASAAATTATTTAREEIEQALIPLSVDIVRSFSQLDEETQQRNISIWRPVVIDVLAGFTAFSEPDFRRHMPTFAPLLVALMGRYLMGSDLQQAIQLLLLRIFELQFTLDMSDLRREAMATTPISPSGHAHSSHSRMASASGAGFHRRTGSRQLQDD